MKKLKIVHCANFSYPKDGELYYATDRKVTHGLIRNGHYVYDFSHRDVARCSTIFRSKMWGLGKTNKRLIETCRNIQPDLLLLGHAELITPETLLEIRKIIPSIKIAMWFVDPLWTHQHAVNVQSKIPVLDCFFATTGGEMLKELKRPSNKVAYMPNIADASIESHKNFEKEDLSVDFLFCGRDYNEPERKAFLVEISQKLSSYQTKLFGCLGRALILGHEYTDMLGETKMGLSYNRRNDVSLYMSDRIVQLTGNGIATFTPRVPNMEMLYSEDEVIYFDDVSDLIRKAEKISKDDKMRKRIAYNGWKKTQNSYNSVRITKFMLETIFGESYSEAYEWINEVY
jgi:spore maturation protein CgeB